MQRFGLDNCTVSEKNRDTIAWGPNVMPEKIPQLTPAQMEHFYTLSAQKAACCLGQMLGACRQKRMLDVSVHGLHHKTNLALVNHAQWITGAHQPNWQKVVCAAEVIAAAYFQMCRKGAHPAGQPFNLVLDGQNFLLPLAGYAIKRMGLPVHKVICAFSPEDFLTHFVQKGRLDFAQEVTELHDTYLQMFLYYFGGTALLEQYERCRDSKCNFLLAQAQWLQLCDFCTAIACTAPKAKSFAQKATRGMEHSLSLQAAVAYYALQHYRVIAGESTSALVISIESGTSACINDN